MLHTYEYEYESVALSSLPVIFQLYLFKQAKLTADSSKLYSLPSELNLYQILH